MKGNTGKPKKEKTSKTDTRKKINHICGITLLGSFVILILFVGFAAVSDVANPGIYEPFAPVIEGIVYGLFAVLALSLVVGVATLPDLDTDEKTKTDQSDFNCMKVSERFGPMYDGVPVIDNPDVAGVVRIIGDTYVAVGKPLVDAKTIYQIICTKHGDVVVDYEDMAYCFDEQIRKHTQKTAAAVRANFDQYSNPPRERFLEAAKAIHKEETT